MAAVLHSLLIPTPLGEMLAIASDRGLCLLDFAEQKSLQRHTAQVRQAHGGVEVASATRATAATAVLHATQVQLAQYFAGQRQAFDVPLDWVGTDFQVRVWQTLLRIPFGQTCSYAQQSEALGQPRAVRAVANANGQNKISIIVPCHRVVGSNGTLTGYAGGLPRKQALIALEAGQQDFSRHFSEH